MLMFIDINVYVSITLVESTCSDSNHVSLLETNTLKLSNTVSLLDNYFGFRIYVIITLDIYYLIRENMCLISLPKTFIELCL